MAEPKTTPDNDAWKKEAADIAKAEAKVFIEEAKDIFKRESSVDLEPIQKDINDANLKMMAAGTNSLREFWLTQIKRKNLELKHAVDNARLEDENNAIALKKAFIASSLAVGKKLRKIGLELAIKHGLDTLGKIA